MNCDNPDPEESPEPGLRSGALPISPSLVQTLQAIHFPEAKPSPHPRMLFITLLAMLLGVIAGPIAQALKYLIYLFTNLAYHGRLSFHHAAPAGHGLGWFAILVPVIGGLVVGVMARYGSQGIRGHGIPEAMEKVLSGESRIPARLTWLKPLSAAISIGTGGPFGAEGPIIATGGALGSLWGQILHTSAAERKTLLGAGAAAGMSATFGSPVAAVLLAVELLLFEFRPRSVIPVALASALAAGMRSLLEGSEPVFAMPALAEPALAALVGYIVIGAAIGAVSTVVTRIVYGIEDAFDKLPIHWMWWPALGGVAVGVVGLAAPRTLGVGYDNITDIISGNLGLGAVAILCGLKFVSWAISLGSGTSGGTLAPLFTIGGGLGALLGAASGALAPGAGIDPRMAALVGMAAIFSGASRAFLASTVFAFETTRQAPGLLPLLGGCAAAYFVSHLLMRETIMTEKIARRGIRVPSEYEADPLAHAHVSRFGRKKVATLAADQTVEGAAEWLRGGAEGSRHQGYPVLDARGTLVGVLTRRILLEGRPKPGAKVADLIDRPPVAIYEDCTLRDAVGHMTRHDIGRIPVLTRTSPARLVGFLTRGDILDAYRVQMPETKRARVDRVAS